MIKYINECWDCKTEGYPCLGKHCPNKDIKVLICDNCKNEVDFLYKYENIQLCEECLLSKFECITMYED